LRAAFYRNLLGYVKIFICLRSIFFYAFMTSSLQIPGWRRIELSNTDTNYSTDGYPSAPDPYPMIAKMRNKAAAQIFESLHPSVLKIRRSIGGTKSQSAKQAVRLANAGLWLEAVAAAEQGVQELPTDPEARYILAIVYQGTGRYADTDKTLKQLVGMSPNAKYAKAIRENQAVWQNAARFQQQM
jgi:tetratricopeptide (TPR) repeat protein